MTYVLFKERLPLGSGLEWAQGPSPPEVPRAPHGGSHSTVYIRSAEKAKSTDTIIIKDCDCTVNILLEYNANAIATATEFT